MPSKPLLLIGNMIAIAATIATFLQALSWSIAGMIILVSLIIPLLININPPGGAMQSHNSSKTMSTNHPSNETKTLPNKQSEKRVSLQHPSLAKVEPRSLAKPEQVRIVPPKPGAKLSASTVLAPTMGPPKTPAQLQLPPLKQGPNFNPTIAKGDYAEYEIQLDAKTDFSGEVTADGLVNVYVLDEDNLDNLDQGEEFWSETGEEAVESAKLEFTPTSKGTWFFVVENADDQPVAVTVKIHKGFTPANHP